LIDRRKDKTSIIIKRTIIIMKTFISASLIALVSFGCYAPEALADGRVKARGKNGVVAATSVNGNTVVRGRGHTTNDAGVTTGVSGGAYKTRNGAIGARGSSTIINPDGSGSRQSGAVGYGQYGSYGTTGSSSRNADGSVNANRNSSATNAHTGNSYNGQTTYSTQDGVNHTGTCSTSTGEIIPCRR
jgi:hypothetical protein